MKNTPTGGKDLGSPHGQTGSFQGTRMQLHVGDGPWQQLNCGDQISYQKENKTKLSQASSYCTESVTAAGT